MYELVAIIILIVLVVWYLRQSNKLSNVSQVVLFYRPGCPWCDLFKPEWSVIEKALGQRAQKINTADDRSGMSQKYKVEGVPTILFMDNQGNFEQYTGNRTASAMLAELSRRMV